MDENSHHEKAKRIAKNVAITSAVVLECGIIFLAYLGGGQLAQDIYHDPEHKEYCLNNAIQNALYGWDRLFNLGICA